MSSITWTDKSHSHQLVFELSSEKRLHVDLYQKIAENFEPTSVRIDEKNITIETKNLSQILRGIPQKTFTLQFLTPTHKENILSSLLERGIEIIQGVSNEDSYLIIHALS